MKKETSASNVANRVLYPIKSHSAPILIANSTDRKSTRLNSSHLVISYAVFCLKKKKTRLSMRPGFRDISTSASRLLIYAFVVDIALAAVGGPQPGGQQTPPVYLAHHRHEFHS